MVTRDEWRADIATRIRKVEAQLAILHSAMLELGGELAALRQAFHRHRTDEYARVSHEKTH